MTVDSPAAADFARLQEAAQQVSRDLTAQYRAAQRLTSMVQELFRKVHRRARVRVAKKQRLNTSLRRLERRRLKRERA